MSFCAIISHVFSSIISIAIKEYPHSVVQSTSNITIQVASDDQAEVILFVSNHNDLVVALLSFEPEII